MAIEPKTEQQLKDDVAHYQDELNQAIDDLQQQQISFEEYKLVILDLEEAIENLYDAIGIEATNKWLAENF